MQLKTCSSLIMIMRFILLYSLVLLTTAKSGLSETRKTGCAKSAFHTRSNLPRPKSFSKVHILPNELLKGLKRSVTDDCGGKKSDITIHQKAFGSLPRKTLVTLPTLRNNTKRSQTTGPLALSHIVKTANAIKRGLPKTPNLKTLRNSPLWSLSKLIDDVSSISDHKRRNITSDILKIKETSSDYHPIIPKMSENKQKTGTTKENVDVFENKGLKATLAKAIEKVERVVASKHGDLGKNKDALGDAERLLAVIKKVNKTIEGVKKTVQNKTVKVTDTPIKSPSSASSPISKPLAPISNSTTLKAAEKKPVVDPYAEIAAGPDRPKIPELKGGDDPPNVSAMMKLPSGNVQSNVGSSSMDDSKPLSGQHDVGGLLDSLTDKLNNAAGGGVANDQPLNGNEVKYMQQQLGMEEEAEKQNEGLNSAGMTQAPPAPPPEAAEQQQQQEPEPEQNAAMSEQNAAVAMSHELPSPMDGVRQPEPESQMGRMIDDQGTAKMEAPQSEDGGLDKEVMDKLAATEEGLSKTISEKSSSLSKLGAMDLLKGTKSTDEMTDYTDADISPGPDPYTLPQDSARNNNGDTPVGTAYGSHEMETSELLNGGERSEGMGQAPGGYEEAEDNSPVGSFEQRASDLTGDTRSQTGSDSYLTAAMGGMGEEGGYSTTRQHIPETNIDPDSFSNSYSTQMFKKNIILRPKKDTYVSPFSGKESFENDI